jgi:Sulfotransferase family
LESSAASLLLINDSALLSSLRLMVFAVALRDSHNAPEVGEQRQTAIPSVPGPRAGENERDPQFDRPVFIISAPRSGSTLLFEILAKAPNLFTIGDESHALIEGLQGLHPRDQNYDSNRLEALTATPALAEELRRRFLAEMRDRNGRAPQQLPIRMLEKTPKNALRIPFLAKVFPQAQFVYLYRDPRETLSSMIEAWESAQFRTYRKLPGWKGLPWSLLLVPGWRALDGRPLHKVVSAQWETTTRILLDDLESLPPGRCHVARYDALVGNPAAEVTRLCAELGLDWDSPLGALPRSRYTVTEPASDKWRRHAALIEEVLPGLQTTISRAERFTAR